MVLVVDDGPFQLDGLPTQRSCLTGYLPVRTVKFHDHGGNLQDAVPAHDDFLEDLAFPIKELNLEGCGVLPGGTCDGLP